MLAEGEEAALSRRGAECDNEVVNHRDVNDFRSHEKCVGQFDVLYGGRGVVRRMRVTENK